MRNEIVFRKTNEVLVFQKICKISKTLEKEKKLIIAIFYFTCIFLVTLIFFEAFKKKYLKQAYYTDA